MSQRKLKLAAAALVKYFSPLAYFGTICIVVPLKTKKYAPKELDASLAQAKARFSRRRTGLNGA